MDEIFCRSFIREKWLLISPSYIREYSLSVRCVEKSVVFATAVSPGVSGASQVGGAPGAGVHARSFATSSFGGARLARKEIVRG